MKRVLSAIFIIIALLIIVPYANAGLQDAFTKTLPSVAKKGGYVTNGEISVESSISKIINGVLSLIGLVFVVLIIYSGIIWMTAGGQEKKVEEAKGTIKQSIIGLIVVLGAYALSYFIVNALSSGAGGMAS